LTRLHYFPSYRIRKVKKEARERITKDKREKKKETTKAASMEITNLVRYIPYYCKSAPHINSALILILQFLHILLYPNEIINYLSVLELIP
jgi:hypothetical protein